jgi:hypothetical protein
MDTAPRSAFLAGVVEPHERTPMLGFIYVARSSAASIGPIITGAVAGKGMLWVAFVTAGSLMVVYDLGVLIAFKNHKRQCEKDSFENQTQDEENSGSVKSVEAAEAKGAVGEGEKAELTAQLPDVERCHK